MRKYLKIKVIKLYGGSKVNDIMNIVFDKSAHGDTGEKDLFKAHNSPMTFGTLEKTGLDNIINFYKEKVSDILSNKNFIDLGSGDGRVSIWASTYGFSNSDGVELSPKRHNIAINHLKKIDSNNINFFNDNILNHDIQKYDLMYISSLCFNNELIKKVAEKIDLEGKINSMIVSSVRMPLKKYKFIKKSKTKQSWGDSELYTYLKEN